MLRGKQTVCACQQYLRLLKTLQYTFSSIRSVIPTTNITNILQKYQSKHNSKVKTRRIPTKVCPEGLYIDN